MVAEPARHIPQIAAAGGDSVTFHVEAQGEPAAVVALARSLDLGVGLALRPDTAVEDAVRASDGADFVLCMSIHPGYSGQEFMPEALERIARLREALPAGVGVSPLHWLAIYGHDVGDTFNPVEISRDGCWRGDVGIRRILGNVCGVLEIHRRCLSGRSVESQAARLGPN